MSEPQRIQRKRTKGWRMPEGAVYVGRPTRWGNPCRWFPMPAFDPSTGETTPADPVEARRISVNGFRSMLAEPDSRALNGYPSDAEIRAELAGRNLCCWCPLDQPCHADVLLEVANGGRP